MRAGGGRGGGRETGKMTLRLVSILSMALLLVLPAQLDAFITQNTGCHHNGTWYADKSVVPSMEKCLNCQCNRKTLVCRLKVCPEMPMPPPRGCVVVQKKNTCCPYLSCARLDAFYKIPTKRRIIAYLDHYERESIDRVVNDNMLQRRSDDSDVDLFVCVKNGTVYKSGSAMSSSNLCSYCYCIGGTEKCVKPKCMLPVEGCKPIFVDSTCCPVRYDCSSKTSGKSSQEVRYRKTSNKHFQRMSQRLQRNRGCTVGSQFYAEGQKMRSDADKPCDICFCIRGTRRCAPKKCSPALKNCIPVVPKGQCCPSSYDCGSQRDYRRSQSSRQFNLYNLLFGKEEQEAEAAAASVIMPTNTMAEHYPLDRHPTEAPAGDALQASSEKSIMDTLREGLEFIDGNNNKMLASNLDLVTAAPLPVAIDISSTTEISFLDLLLGPSTENEVKVAPESTTVKKPLSWVDILLGPDEEEPATVTESTEDTSTSLTQPGEPPSTTTMSSIKRFADDFNDELGSDEIAVGELPAEAQHIALVNQASWTTSSTTAKPPNLLNVLLDGLSDMLDDNATTTTSTAATTTTVSSSSSSSSSTTTTTTTARPPSTVRAPPMFRPLSNHKVSHNRINSKLANLTVTPPMLLVTSKYGQPVTFRTVPSSSSTTSTTTSNTSTTAKPTTTSTTTTSPKPSSTTRKPTTTTTTSRSTTTKSKPKTSRRTTTTTTTPKPTTTIRTTIRSTLRHKTSPHFTSSPKPLIIQTNPSILEAEPLDDSDSTAPTLPPSLPNLKIIPFLPTDAVNTVPKLAQPPGGYNSPNSYYPSPEASDKMDTNFDANYQETGGVQYPAITSAYPQQQQAAMTSDQAAYKYQFNVEVPVAEPPPEPVVHVGGQFKGSADYVSYEFDQQVVPPVHSGFSPPTETEGGFMPKEPLVIDGEVLQDHVTSNVLHAIADNYHVTQHIIDITTPQQPNDTASIEITTPDPFKDVIHTERPPNLDALIVDKQHKTPTEKQQQQQEQEQPQHEQQLQQQQLQHTESVTYSISNSSGSKAPTAATTTTAAAVTTAATKQTLLIDKNEINNLDQLLDELLAMELPSTVPPFRTLPTLSSTKAGATTTTATATTTAGTTAAATTTTATRPTATIRGSSTKKGSKPTKGKPANGNKRNNAPTTIQSTKPTRSKGQAATRRTPASSSSSSSNNNRNNTTAVTSLTSVKTKSTAATTAATSSTRTTAKPAPTTTTSIKPTTRATTTVEPPTAIASSTVHPILMSPFDKLPFIDTSYEVRPHMLLPQQQHLLQPLQEVAQAPQQFHHYQHAPSSSSSSTTSTTTAAAPTAAGGGDTAEGAGSVGGFDNLMNPTGMLKLAGCNIYGRMYRVGRIIVELSNQCLECKCTEVGVKCGPLDC